MQASFLTSKKDTWASGIDARIKLVLCAGASISALILSSPYSLLVLILFGLVMARAATSFSLILKVFLLFTAMFIMSLLFTWLLSLVVPGLIKLNAISLTVPYLRMLVPMLFLITLAVSTPVQVITETLRSLRLPGFLYIPLSVAIRFLPTFIDDCQQIRDAAKLRPGKGFARMWRGLLVPLVFRMFSSADDLSIAAELKGMKAGVVATVPPLPALTSRDFTVLACAVAALVIAFLLQYLGPQVASIMP